MRAPTRARLLGGLAACLGLAWGTPALGESLSLWNLAKPEFIAPNLEPGIIAQYPDHLGTLIGLVPPPFSIANGSLR